MFCFGIGAELLSSVIPDEEPGPRLIAPSGYRCEMCTNSFSYLPDSVEWFVEVEAHLTSRNRRAGHSSQFLYRGALMRACFPVGFSPLPFLALLDGPEEAAPVFPHI